MKAFQFQLLFVVVLTIIKLSESFVIDVYPGRNPYATFPIRSTGFCHEFTRTGEGDGVVYYKNNSYINATYYDIRKMLQPNVVESFYFDPVPDNEMYEISFMLEATGSTATYIDLVYAFSKPCNPNNCTVRELCIVQHGCSSRCEAAPEYDCSSNSPCTAANAAAQKFYFANQDPNKYVQCSEDQRCWIRSCAAGLVWSQQILTCTWP